MPPDPLFQRSTIGLNPSVDWPPRTSYIMYLSQKHIASYIYILTTHRHHCKILARFNTGITDEFEREDSTLKSMQYKKLHPNRGLISKFCPGPQKSFRQPCPQGLIQGVDGMASHPCTHELYSFIIFSQNCFQIQSLKDKLFPEGMPHADSLARSSSSSLMLSVIYKLCKLGHMHTWGPNLKPNLASHPPCLFLGQCLSLGKGSGYAKLLHIRMYTGVFYCSYVFEWVYKLPSLNPKSQS